jgi:hypothetical protein
VTDPVLPGKPSLRTRPSWTLLPGSLGAIGCALVLFASMRAAASPLWLAIAAAVTLFPVLPLAWHIAAERQRGRPGSGLPLDRLALRALGLGMLALAISFGTLGPRGVSANVRRLFRPRPSAGLSSVPPPGAPPASGEGPATKTSRRHDLEAFIPADANLVVALSDAALQKELLATTGADRPKTLAAFEKCQISLDHALVLIAVRDRGTHLVVVRAPGITEQRNLYCLVGFLGTDRLSLRVLGNAAPLRFEVGGLLAQPMKFEAVDAQTIVAAEGAWAGASPKALFPAGGDKAQGPLGAVLERVDRGASLWSAGFASIHEKSWDLALDARIEGARFELRGSSTPPSGESDRAEIQARVPLAFARSLPASALRDGIRGAAAVLASFLRLKD